MSFFFLPHCTVSIHLIIMGQLPGDTKPAVAVAWAAVDVPLYATDYLSSCTVNKGDLRCGKNLYSIDLLQL